MIKSLAKPAIIAGAVFLSACAMQPTEDIGLDVQQDADTSLFFQGEAYELSYDDADKLRAIADEMAESFYWHSLPTRPIEASLSGQKPAWTLHQRTPGRPSLAFDTPSAEQLKARIDEMYDDFAAYQAAYREAHPDSSEVITCSTDTRLCEQYVAADLRQDVRALSNRYIAEVLDDQLGSLGEIDLTADQPSAQISPTEKPLILIKGVYNVDALSAQNAASLFHDRTFMVGMGPYPCLFLLDANKATSETVSRTMNASNTAFCGIKLYSGFTAVANHLDTQH